MKTISLSLLLSSSAAFAPSTFTTSRGTTTTTTDSTTSLGVSVVSQFVRKQKKTDADTQKLLRTFETETPESVGVRVEQQPANTIKIHKTENEAIAKRRRQSSRTKRKHNFKEQETFLKEEPDLAFYTLHSAGVSHLTKDMPINDILRAIKRAQNLHDYHDLATIAAFVIDECDENWGYGFRGSLLSRLAVAAFHMDEVDIARQAIETRKVFERASMQAHESAAIVRGLMRTGNVEEGWEVLEDELRLPMTGTDVKGTAAKEVLKHRARSLASIASRHFYSGEPYVAAKALGELGELGSIIEDSHMKDGELDMPWARLVEAANVCEDKLADDTIPLEYTDDSVELPSDLTELVWNAMLRFPCPGDMEECSLEDHFATV